LVAPGAKAEPAQFLYFAPYAWYKTYGATLRRRSLHASSQTTTKAAPHNQCGSCGLLDGYMGTHPSRRLRYGWL
jgi:hypothetical protein